MSRKQTILKGTFVLTVTGLITRCMGFFFRIFLSHIFGDDGVGLYQLVFPVYALCYSLTSAGIELALSRSVSKYYALGNKNKVRHLLYTAVIITLWLSLIMTVILQMYCQKIAFFYLHKPETAELLMILSYVFPFAAVHSCIVGYFLGLKQTKVPAFSQLIEQCARIISVYIIYQASKIYCFNFRIHFSILGLIIGELFSCIYCINSIFGKRVPLSFHSFSAAAFISCTKELFTLSMPLTASRVMINILQSIEAISIPLYLSTYGYSSSESLSIYGVLTGMALPCILFPSAITNAVSTMLLPTVAEIQALKHHSLLSAIMKKALLSCTLLGLLCFIIFQLLGETIGNILFNSMLAGKFIITLSWICPFLYTNNTVKLFPKVYVCIFI